MKLLVFDTETTGVLYYRHCIHQLSGMVVIDDVIVEKFNFFIRPHEKAEIDPQALKISEVTLEQVMQYPHRDVQHRAFKAILDKYIDIYNPEDKFFLLGYNNSWFDNEFLRNFLILQDDHSFGSYFFQNTLDAMILATQYLLPDRHKMPSFKLKRVAIWLGIQVDESRLHDGLYDAELTWAIYNKVKGKTIDDW